MRLFPILFIIHLKILHTVISLFLEKKVMGPFSIKTSQNPRMGLTFGQKSLFTLFSEFLRI